MLSKLLKYLLTFVSVIALAACGNHLPIAPRSLTPSLSVPPTMDPTSVVPPTAAQTPAFLPTQTLLPSVALTSQIYGV